MMRRCVLLTAAGLITVLVQGCIISHKTIHSAVYRGRVIDADTQQPIRNAQVEVQAQGLRESAKSDVGGNFEVGPLHCQRLMLFVPPEGKFPLDCKHMIPDNALFSFIASRSGYEPTKLLVPVYGTNWSREVDLKDISLKPSRRTKE